MSWINFLCVGIGFLVGVAIFCAYEHWMAGLFVSFLAMFASVAIYISCTETEQPK